MRLTVAIVAWLAVVLALALAGCDGVRAVDVAASDAAADAQTVDRLPTSPAVEASAAASDAAAPRDVHEAASCAAWSSPPYCASCRDARGVCMCGALPCCDQHCQS
jgi:hypothetical protein